MKIRLPAAAAAITVSLSSAAVAHGTTYTVEPFDFDGVFGIVHTLTQVQLGGSLCPA